MLDEKSLKQLSIIDSVRSSGPWFCRILGDKVFVLRMKEPIGVCVTGFLDSEEGQLMKEASITDAKFISFLANNAKELIALARKGLEKAKGKDVGL